MSSNCKYYEGLIDHLLDGDLLPTEEEALRLHLGNCRDCRTLCRELSAVTLLVRSELAEAPASLAAGVMSRIAQASAPESPAEAPAEAPAQTAPEAVEAAEVPAAGAEDHAPEAVVEPQASAAAPAPAPEAKPAQPVTLDYDIPALELDIPAAAPAPAPAAAKVDTIENIAVSDEPTIKVEDLSPRKGRSSKKAAKAAQKDAALPAEGPGDDAVPKRASRTDRTKSEKRARTEEPKAAADSARHAPPEPEPKAEDKTSRPARRPVRIWPRVLIAACAVLIIGGVAYGAIRVVNGESVEELAASLPFAAKLGVSEAPAAAVAEEAGGAGVYEFSVTDDEEDTEAEEPAEAVTSRADRVAMTTGNTTVPEGREADFEALLQDARWGEDGEPEAEWTVIANVEYNGVIYEFSTDEQEQYLRWRDAAEGMPVHSPGTVAELLDIIG